MKIRISKLTFFLIILVLLGPIFDILTGFTLKTSGLANTGNVDAITPGVFYRGVFLIPVFILLAHLIKSSTRLIIYYFGIIFVLGILLRGFSGDQLELARNSQRFLKLMLPIFGFTGMLYLGNHFTRNKPHKLFWRTAALYGGIAALGLLLTDAVGLALNVYRGTNVASAGLIDSQNAAGLVLIVSLPLALYYVYKYRNNGLVSMLIVQGLWLAAAFRLNTRAALVAVPTVLIIHHTYLFFKGQYTKTNFKTISWIVMLILTAVIVFFIIQAWLGRDVAYVFDRFERLAEGQFRSRVPFGIARIQQFGFIDHLFGIGDRAFSTTENDLVDVYGKFGLTTLLPILIFYSYFFSRLVVNFIRHRNHSAFALLLSVSLYMIHGVTAGHALLSSPVNNLFFLVYFMSYLEFKRYEPERVPDNQPVPPPVGQTTAKTPLVYDG